MYKKISLGMFSLILVAAIVLMSGMATAQHKMMKSKHHEKTMDKCKQGENGHHSRMKCGNGAGCATIGCPNCLLGMKDDLQLTQEQVESLQALKSETEKRKIKHEAELDILRIELHELMAKDNVDVKSVDAKAEKMGTLQTSMHKAKIHTKLNVQKVLTSEQRKKFTELKGTNGSGKKNCQTKRNK